MARLPNKRYIKGMNKRRQEDEEEEGEECGPPVTAPPPRPGKLDMISSRETKHVFRFFFSGEKTLESRNQIAAL